MPGEAAYSVSEWGEGYWRWQCTAPRRHGCYGILGPPFSREDAEAAAAQHRADMHEGLLSDLLGVSHGTRPRPARQLREQTIREKGVAHGLAQLAERASEQRRRTN